MDAGIILRIGAAILASKMVLTQSPICVGIRLWVTAVAIGLCCSLAKTAQGGTLPGFGWIILAGFLVFGPLAGFMPGRAVGDGVKWYSRRRR